MMESMAEYMCDWVCAVCGEVARNRARAILVQCQCGGKCLRLLPGGSSGPRSLRRSLVLPPVNPSVGNGASVAGGRQLFLGGIR